MFNCSYCGRYHSTQRQLEAHLKFGHGIRIVYPEVTKVKKFYVGAETPHTNGWGKDTLEEAIQHGKQLMRDDKSKEIVYIVQVVKVLRRPLPEVVIEDVT